MLVRSMDRRAVPRDGLRSAVIAESRRPCDIHTVSQSRMRSCLPNAVGRAARKQPVAQLSLALGSTLLPGHSLFFLR